MSGEQTGRHEPDGKEDGIDSSLNLAAPQNTLEGSQEETVINLNEAVEACTNEVTPISNQLSDDSLEEDAGPDIPVVANVARDDKIETGHNETNSKAATSDLIEAASQGTHEQGKTTDDRSSLASNGGSTVTPVSSSGHVTDKSDNAKRDVSKVTASGGSLQSNSAKLSQSSSRFSTSSSRIPVLKGSKTKPSPLLEPHKASTSSVAVATPGEFPQQEVNSQYSSENTDTPVSVALQEIPSFDSLHQDFNRTGGNARKEANLSNIQKETTTVTAQTHHRGWNSHRYPGKPSQLPVPMKRRQDGHVLKNNNSFNSYVHEQMAITMAMMEANFEGVGLSNTQQERVEELRAGLDSFSLTNITAAPVQEQKTVFKNNRLHHHDNHGYSNHGDMWLPEHRKQHDVDHYGRRAYHDQGMHQLYRSQSYSTNPNHGGHGNAVHHQRRGSEIPHDDSFGMKRHGSYLQQQLDRRDSYLQQSKLAQSIKSLRPPKLKPLPRKRSSNYLQNYIKSNSNRPAGRVREWSPAHVMPPLDESMPLSHTHYWMGDHMISDGNYGDCCNYNTQHHYPVLPNIGDNYSSISLHPVKPYNSYQQQCPGPPHGAAAHPRGNYYIEHNYWRHRN